MASRPSRPPPLIHSISIHPTLQPEDDSFDLDASVDAGMAKLIDPAGAGRSVVSPGWLTQLGRLWGGASEGVPVADAQPADIADLLGGALFRALFKWMVESGPVYLLPTGPVSSFLVVSDPAAAKHVLRATDNPNSPIYEKGLVAEVSEFLFGSGFAISGGDAWRLRRRAVGPALHKGYLEVMLSRVFSPAALRLNEKLAKNAAAGTSIDIEACFSQLTLDIIGLAVFNYDFDALTSSSPVIQAVYTALKETESRATDVLPLWKLPFWYLFDPRQKKAKDAVALIRATTEDLVARCRAMVEAEAAGSGDLNDPAAPSPDPSILRFLIASREEVSATQLRDDLLSMLVAGHETTASVLTWTVYLLCQNPEAMATAQAEVDSVLGDEPSPSISQYPSLRYLTRCVSESMRLYPHPPVLLRRARVAATLPPGNWPVPPGQDVMISVFNIHHSPAVWGPTAEEFNPLRFGPLEDPHPTEVSTDYKFIPFSGGPRKCVGDQFAVMEAVSALAVLLKRFDVSLTPGQKVEMTTGATIHTTSGLYVNVKERSGAGGGVGRVSSGAVVSA